MGQAVYGRVIEALELQVQLDGFRPGIAAQIRCGGLSPHRGGDDPAMFPHGAMVHVTSSMTNTIQYQCFAQGIAQLEFLRRATVLEHHTALYAFFLPETLYALNSEP